MVLENNIEDTKVLEGSSEESPVPIEHYNVTSYGWDSDVDGLVRRLKRNDIYVPGFQRGFVWSKLQQSRFIESLILELPVPNIFLAKDVKTGKLNIVDGQQRLRTLQDFLEGKFYLTGQGIHEELKGCYYSRNVAKNKRSKVLSDKDNRALVDRILHSIVIKPDPTHDDPERGHEYNQAVIQIFRRLNTGGTQLSAHEIRTSIFYGSLDSFIRELNEKPAWRELFGPPHSRLKDMELILRFIALREDGANYTSPMPRFLNKFMEENRNMLEERLKPIGEAFGKTTDLIEKTIGKTGLRSGTSIKAARFDAVMSGFDAYLRTHTESSREDILARLEKLNTDKSYMWSIEEAVNDSNRLKTRMDRARAIFGA